MIPAMGVIQTIMGFLKCQMQNTGQLQHPCSSLKIQEYFSLHTYCPVAPSYILILNQLSTYALKDPLIEITTHIIILSGSSVTPQTYFKGTQKLDEQYF